MHNITRPWITRAFLIEIITHEGKRDNALWEQKHEEFLQLVKTHGNIEIIEALHQYIDPAYKTYIWSGKLQEIRERMLHEEVPLLIIWNIMKPSQIFNVNEYLRVGESSTEEEFDLQIWDKVDLLLKIFDRHAQSTEAKLQVELAAIKHMGPRIFGMGMELSRQGWWIGTSGIGETNTEIMRRHLQIRRTQIQKELKKYEKVRKVHREARKKRRLPTIGLVGYTNSGKSSLMNALTNKGVLVENKLFATLGTDVGQLYIPSMTWKWTTLLINDTIGFMRDLPPGLLDAFRSTLEDSVEADILLHVVDVTDPMIADKIDVVDEILDSIGARQERVLVFNKIDMLAESNKQQTISNKLQVIHWEEIRANDVLDLQGQLKKIAWGCQCLFVSAHTGEWLEEIKELMVEKTKWR